MPRRYVKYLTNSIPKIDDYITREFFRFSDFFVFFREMLKARWFSLMNREWKGNSFRIILPEIQTSKLSQLMSAGRGRLLEFCRLVISLNNKNKKLRRKVGTNSF